MALLLITAFVAVMLRRYDCINKFNVLSILCEYIHAPLFFAGGRIKNQRTIMLIIIIMTRI